VEAEIARLDNSAPYRKGFFFWVGARALTPIHDGRILKVRTKLNVFLGIIFPHWVHGISSTFGEFTRSINLLVLASDGYGRRCYMIMIWCSLSLSLSLSPSRNLGSFALFALSPWALLPFFSPPPFNYPRHLESLASFCQFPPALCCRVIWSLRGSCFLGEHIFDILGA